MFGNRVSLSLILAALLAGCSASPSHGDKSRGSGSNGESASGKGGDADSSVGSGDFGNTGNTAENVGGGGSMDAGEVCEAGTFCKAKTPDGNCGSLTLDTDVKQIKKPGNVLVIFDRSGSMDQDWGGTPKYKAAGNALIAALTPLQDLLTVGGIFFPSVDDMMGGCACNAANPLHWIPGPGACCLNGAAQSCVTSSIDKPDEISFRAGPAFIAEVPNQWRLQGANGTPLEQGVTRGAEALMAQTFTDPVTIVILTDGQPNCGTNQQNVLDQVTAWKTAGITTHVVGLPGSEGAKDLLNMMAVAGGSGQYIDPADPTELEMRLNAVFTSTIKVGFDSCTIHLDPAADAPDKLHLVVKQNGTKQDVPRDLSKDASWSINKTGDTVVLKGQLCTMAKEGKFESLTFEYGCVDLPPLPPPPPVE